MTSDAYWLIEFITVYNCHWFGRLVIDSDTLTFVEFMKASNELQVTVSVFKSTKCRAKY